MLEALAHKPEAVVRVLRARGAKRGDVDIELKRTGVSIADFDPRTPPAGVPSDAVHQGVIAEVQPGKLMRSYAKFWEDAEVTDDTVLVVLGEVQDPQNVGAIIRSAAAFGAAGVLIPEHRQAPVTGTVVKVSAGAVFSVPLVSIGNVNTVLRDLKERGFWIYGLAGEGGTSIHEEDFRKPSVIVVGGEGPGLREKTLEECDIALSIPIHSRIESLNAATATSIALYQWSVRHSGALW